MWLQLGGQDKMGLRVRTIATEVVRFAVCVHLHRNISSMHKTQKITMASSQDWRENDMRQLLSTAPG